jgi:hypothetical protein
MFMVSPNVEQGKSYSACQLKFESEAVTSRSVQAGCA